MRISDWSSDVCSSDLVYHRQGLPRKDEAGGLAATRQDDPPRLGDFIGVGGAQVEQTWDAAEPQYLLDRLMSRSVLTDADGIVGEDEDDRKLHQRREELGRASGRERVGQYV